MMGTGPFAVPTFRALVASRHDVPVLYTQPLRGKPGEQVNPMRAAAEELGVEVRAAPDINQESAVAELQQLDADLLVVCDYGQILSAAALAAARLGGINLHGSYLPKYRGAAPIQWAIFHGESTTGVSVIHMTPRLDAGPCLVQLEEPIRDDDDSVSLEKRLSERGVATVLESIQMLADWNGEDDIGVVQDNRHATKAPRLKKNDGRIDWRRSAVEIERQLRAFTPWPGTFTFVPRRKGDPQRLIVAALEVLTGVASDRDPGTVLVAEGDQLHIATGDGVLAIREVQPAGKRSMQVDEYLRGSPLAAGHILP